MKYILLIFMSVLMLDANSNDLENDKEKMFLGKIHVGSVSDKDAYVYKKDTKLVYSLEGKKTIIENKISSDSYWLKTSGKYVYVFWWEKFAPIKQIVKDKNNVGKVLYVRVSQDGGKSFSKRDQIASGGILPELKIVADKKGNVALVYLDERYKGHQIFFNASQDGGKSWLINDIRLNNSEIKPEDIKETTVFSAVSPNIGLLDGELIVVWEQRNDGKLNVVSRVSTDFGKSWGDELLVYKSLTSVRMAMSADKRGGFVVTYQPNIGLKAFTKDKSSGWKEVEGIAPNSSGVGHISSFEFATDEKNIYITSIYGSYKSKEDWHSTLVRINRSKRKWEANTYQLDLVFNKRSRGGYSDVATLDDGVVVVVWEDYRNILPSIYLDFSTDYGTTWLSDPISLTKPGKSHATFPFIIKKINGFRVYFGYVEYMEGKRPQNITRSVDVKSLNLAELGKIDYTKNSKSLSDEKLKQRLEKRIKHLMEYRIAKKWKKAWEIMDPVYRSRYKKRSWLATRDRLIFKKFKKLSIDMRLPYASSMVETVYDLSTDFIDAEENDPRFTNVKKKAKLSWGWFGDDWYLIGQSGKDQYLP